MIRIFHQRVLSTLYATIVAALCGAGCGALFGNYVMLLLDKGGLVKDASQAMASAQLRLDESGRVLAALRRVSYSPCSDAELAHFRALIFDTNYLKDVGRTQGSKIICSADLGRLSKPSPMPTPLSTTKDGIHLYKNMDPYRSVEQDLIALQDADFYVVYIPSVQPHSDPGLAHYSGTLIEHLTGKPLPILGESPHLIDAILDRDGHGRAGDTLYATQCILGHPNCITAYLSIPEALQAHHTEVLIYVALGGLIGAILGLFGASVYGRRNRSMDRQLRRAIRNDRLRVVYQPIVDLASGRIVGAEALTRWTDEDGCEVGPDVFIKIAEECGFVGEITCLVLRHALRDFGETLRNISDFRLNINVTATDLADPKFLPMIEHSLDHAGVPARNLGIEITESGTARQQMARDAIQRMHENGHRIYIDDFGTGYSSLAYLHSLTIDAIKIDKAFTQAIGTEAVTATILPQIMAIAVALKLQVIVEGIETGQQADYFEGINYPIQAQGWLYGRPVAPDQFHRLLVADIDKVRIPGKTVRLSRADAYQIPSKLSM